MEDHDLMYDLLFQRCSTQMEMIVKIIQTNDRKTEIIKQKTTQKE